MSIYDVSSIGVRDMMCITVVMLVGVGEAVAA